MQVAGGFALFAILSYATFRAAIEAGRSTDRAAQFGWLVVQFVLFISALSAGFIAPIAITGGGDNAAAVLLVLVFVSYACGAGIGLALTYLEYRLRGRQLDFGQDVRGSMWVGRTGAGRPFQGRRRKR